MNNTGKHGRTDEVPEAAHTQRSSAGWAVLIGVNRYHESLGDLRYSVNDCRRLSEVLATGDVAFQADHVLVLSDDEGAERKPTFANIHSWLASWLAQAEEGDTVLVFFAGHGRETGGNCYLIPGDATLQTIHVTGIPVSYVQELIGRCKARQKMLIIDACHSGAGRDVSTMAASMMDVLSVGEGIYTITSCGVEEVSHEWDEKEQGVFSYYLADAISGSCLPDDRGRVTADAVYDWVYERVRNWAARHRCSQSPQRMSHGAGSLVLASAARSSARRPQGRPGEKTVPRAHETTSSQTRIRPSAQYPQIAMRAVLRSCRRAWTRVARVAALASIGIVTIAAWDSANRRAFDLAELARQDGDLDTAESTLANMTVLPWLRAKRHSMLNSIDSRRAALREDAEQHRRRKFATLATEDGHIVLGPTDFSEFQDLLHQRLVKLDGVLVSNILGSQMGIADLAAATAPVQLELRFSKVLGNREALIASGLRMGRRLRVWGLLLTEGLLGRCWTMEPVERYEVVGEEIK